MNLYICSSHLYVPTVLSLCAKRNEKNYVYTDKDDIRKFFVDFYSGANLYYDNPTKGCVCLRLLSDIQRKKRLERWARKVDITDVYFFHEGYCEAANWLLLFLAQNNNVVFHYVPIARSYFLDGIDKDNSLKAKIKSTYCRFIWGYKPIYPLEDKNCGLMPHSFFDRLRINSEETVEVSREIGKMISMEGYDKNGVVLLDNPNVTNSEAQKKYCIFLEESIRPIINKKPVYFKNHPGRERKIGLENEIKEIPSFISGNLLTHRFKFFVGVNSALLCEAANDDTMAICLAYLVDMDSVERDRIVNYHRLLSKNVMFPKTINELWNMLLEGNNIENN